MVFTNVFFALLNRWEGSAEGEHVMSVDEGGGAH